MAEISAENYEKYLDVVTIIDNKLLNIKKDTAHSSNLSKIIYHEDFEYLVDNFGNKLVSYLIHDMTHKGCSWVHLHLLGYITKTNPVPEEHAGKFYHQIADWINWYLNSIYYPHHIYHDLV